MNTRFVLLLAVLATATLSAQSPVQHDIPLKHWAAPLRWQPQPDLTLAPEAQTTTTLEFVGMTPCRVVDTRAAAGFPAGFGPPSLQSGANRTFPILSSPTCSIPATALAYSFNITAVPPGFLGFITVYPTGQPLPNASTLNSYLGTVVANAAVVPGGTNGSVDVFSHDATDLLIDINGYYIAGGTGGGGTVTAVNAGTGLTGGGTSGSVTINLDTSKVPQLNTSNTFTGNQTVTGNLTATGNVGIGTATPSQKLEVAGNVKVSGTGSGIVFPDGTTQTTSPSGGLGSVVLPAGTATQPSLSFAGSSNTGIYSSASNSVSLVAGGKAPITALPSGDLNIAGSIQLNGSSLLYADADFNVGLGPSVLATLTPPSSNNTALGHDAMISNSQGSGNTAVGTSALVSNTTGNTNVAVGFGALSDMTTGSNNMAIGALSGFYLTTGSNNIFIGYQGNPSIATISGTTIQTRIIKGTLGTRVCHTPSKEGIGRGCATVAIAPEHV